MKGAKKLLVCGDSYMALSPYIFNATGDSSIEQINQIHWTNHISEDYSVINLAQPGASNLMILAQVKKGIHKYAPEAIVIGFTSFERLEMLAPASEKEIFPELEYVTSCHSEMTPDRKKFHALYLDLYPISLRHLQESMVLEYTLLLSAKHAPTAHSMGLASRHVFLEQNQFPRITDPWKSELKTKLTTGAHWGISEKNSGSFHVKDPEHHRHYAKEINDWLLTI